MNKNELIKVIESETPASQFISKKRVVELLTISEETKPKPILLIGIPNYVATQEKLTEIMSQFRERITCYHIISYDNPEFKFEVVYNEQFTRLNIDEIRDKIEQALTPKK